MRFVDVVGTKSSTYLIFNSFGIFDWFRGFESATYLQYLTVLGALQHADLSLPDGFQRRGAAYEPLMLGVDLTEYIYLLVFETLLPHKTVNLIF